MNPLIVNAVCKHSEFTPVSKPAMRIKSFRRKNARWLTGWERKRKNFDRKAQSVMAMLSPFLRERAWEIAKPKAL